ncbi:tetratricopeptide repeat protein [Myxococcaceae bacterium JPH2]|nr:tetratricopeptide repeat protein [Myxococcaceae bacterium JPH2]
MPRRFFLRPWALALLLPLACKDPETVAAQTQAQTAQTALAEGKAALASGNTSRAIAALQRASVAAPESVEPLLLLSDAHQQAGNPGAAILTLKQAEALAPGTDPVIQKQLSNLYLREGHSSEALAILLALRDADQLRDEEVLSLARLQARMGDVDAAFKTLERIQTDRPDDPGAKVVEADILLRRGDEVLAANLMDRLLNQDPGLTAARLLRAHYFLTSGYPDLALADLQGVPAEEGKKLEVVALRAQALIALKRAPEAETALKALLDAEPGNADAMAWLAEVSRVQGRESEALQWVDRSLRVRPRLAQALYVRGRVQEQQSDRRAAEESFRHALSADATFAPALSRVWRIHLDAGRKTDAMSTLERLLGLGEATPEEKATLADLSAQLETQVPRGKKLIEELLKREPANPEYLRIRKALDNATPKTRKRPVGPVIIRGSRR